MRAGSCFALALLILLSVASSAVGGMAVIQTMAPLQDHAKQSIEAAFKEAMQTALKGALAMGFSWVKLSQALVLEDMVTVQILATDTRPEGGEGEGEEESLPGGEPGAGSAQPAGHSL
jgi:hypothetical protein